MNKVLTTRQVMRILRTRNGETQIDMARKLNISQSYLSQIENEKLEMPTWFVSSLMRNYYVPKKALAILKGTYREQKRGVQVIDTTMLTPTQKRVVDMTAKYIQELPDDMGDFVINIIRNSTSAIDKEK